MLELRSDESITEEKKKIEKNIKKIKEKKKD